MHSQRKKCIVKENKKENIPGNLCIIWKINEEGPLKKNSVIFLRLLKLLKLKRTPYCLKTLKDFNIEKKIASLSSDF